MCPMLENRKRDAYATTISRMGEAAADSREALTRAMNNDANSEVRAMAACALTQFSA